MTGHVALRAGIPLMLGIATIGVGRADDWTRELNAGASYGYASNPLLRPEGGLSDRQLLLSASGKLTMSSDRSQWSLLPSFSSTRYDGNAAYDYTNSSLESDFAWQQERAKWNFSAQGGADTTALSEVALTGLTQSNRRHESIALSGGVVGQATERLALFSQLAWSTSHYVDAAGTGLQDYRYASLQFGPTCSLSERLQLSTVFEADTLDLRSGATQNDYSASLRINRTVNEGLTWYIGAGRSLIDFGEHTSNSLLVNVGASWREREKLLWDASLGQDITPLGVGLLARRDRASLAATRTLTEHSSLSVSLNVSRSEPASTAQRIIFSGWEWGQIEGQWKWQISPHWSVNADASYARSRGLGGPWADGNQARLGFAWHEDFLR